MDFVRIRLTYLDSVELTPIMPRWLAEVFCFLFAGGYQWTPGFTVRYARILAELD